MIKTKADDRNKDTCLFPKTALYVLCSAIITAWSYFVCKIIKYKFELKTKI